MTKLAEAPLSAAELLIAGRIEDYIK